MKKIVLLFFTLSLVLTSCSKDEINDFEESTESMDNLKRLRRRPISIRPPFMLRELQCGTPDSFVPLPLSQNQVNQLASQNLSSQSDPININIKFHIVRKDDGTDGISESELAMITSNINSGFGNVLYGILNFVISPQRLHFINSEVNYIDDSSLFINENFPSSSNGNTYQGFNDLTAIDNNPDKINIYIVKELKKFSTQLGGLGTTPGNSVVTTRYNSTYLGSSPTHEVGHNLSLRHTHQSSNSLCLDDNYSSTTGDNIFDTPLDRSMSGLVNNACDYTGSQMTPCGEALGPYISDPHDVLIRNIMSYARKSCRVGFSGTQHLQMNARALSSGLGSVGSLF